MTPRHWVLAGVTLGLAATLALRGAAQAAELPDDPDKSAVVDMCSNCHTLAHSVEKRHTEAEWRAIVDDMRAKGAPGTDDDAAAVVRYLSRYFGPAGK